MSTVRRCSLPISPTATRPEVNVTDITLSPAEQATAALPLVAAQPGIWMAEKLSR